MTASGLGLGLGFKQRIRAGDGVRGIHSLLMFVHLLLNVCSFCLFVLSIIASVSYYSFRGYKKLTVTY